MRALKLTLNFIGFRSGALELVLVKNVSEVLHFQISPIVALKVVMDGEITMHLLFGIREVMQLETFIL
jgi:hypothetical protein